MAAIDKQQRKQEVERLARGRLQQYLSHPSTSSVTSSTANASNNNADSYTTRVESTERFLAEWSRKWEELNPSK